MTRERIPGFIRSGVDWGLLAPIRIRAREIAAGVYSGMHRSALRGTGVEFGGYREYVPGDDLRWLDRRSLLRHERLVVRQFETETDRALCLVVDASASMAFRGPRAPAAKLAFASLVAGALARVALSGGDPVSVTFLGGAGGPSPVARSSGTGQFDRIISALESAQPGGDALVDVGMVNRAVQSVARGARRGSIVVVLSDLIDLPEDAAHTIAAVATGGRVLVVVQTLDPAEVDFPFRGVTRFRSLEGHAVVETDASAARRGYLAALLAQTDRWRRAVVDRGGRFVQAKTSDAPIDAVREIVRAVR